MDFGIGEAALLGSMLGAGVGGATGGGKGALMGGLMGGLTGGMGGAAGGLGAGTIGSSLGLGAGAGTALGGGAMLPAMTSSLGLASEEAAGLAGLAGGGMGAFAPSTVGGLGAGIIKGVDAGTKALGTANTLTGLLGGKSDPSATPHPLQLPASPPNMSPQQGVPNAQALLVSSPAGVPGAVAGTTPMAPPIMAGMSPEEIALLRRYGLLGERMRA